MHQDLPNGDLIKPSPNSIHFCQHIAMFYNCERDVLHDVLNRIRLAQPTAHDSAQPAFMLKEDCLRTCRRHQKIPKPVCSCCRVNRPRKLTSCPSSVFIRRTTLFMHTLLPPASVTRRFFDNFWFRSQIPRLREKRSVPKPGNLKAGRQNQTDKL